MLRFFCCGCTKLGVENAIDFHISTRQFSARQLDLPSKGYKHSYPYTQLTLGSFLAFLFVRHLHQRVEKQPCDN